MKSWIFTFGSDHVHPVTKQPLRDRFTRIEAADHALARHTMAQHFGLKWSSIYETEGAAGVTRFGLTELPRSEWPAAQEITSEKLDAMNDEIGILKRLPPSAEAAFAAALPDDLAASLTPLLAPFEREPREWLPFLLSELANGRFPYLHAEAVTHLLRSLLARSVTPRPLTLYESYVRGRFDLDAMSHDRDANRFGLAVGRRSGRKNDSYEWRSYGVARVTLLHQGATASALSITRASKFKGVQRDNLLLFRSDALRLWRPTPGRIAQGEAMWSMHLDGPIRDGIECDVISSSDAKVQEADHSELEVLTVIVRDGRPLDPETCWKQPYPRT